MSKSLLWQSNFISVIMPVYNCADFVAAAIESISSQTGVDFEFIIVDDASTDHTAQICQSYAQQDPRVKFFQHDSNRGVVAAMTTGLDQATGQFIARMDGDDISLPGRLQLQLNYLQTHPEIIAVGGQCQLINAAGDEIGVKKFPTNPTKARKMLYTGLPIQQPTMMVNRALLPADFIWYIEPDRPTGEEISLYFRLLNFGELVSLSDYVLKYRIHGQNLTLKHLKNGFYLTYKTRQRATAEFGYKPTLWARIVSALQYLAVSILPEKLIWQVYKFTRGMN